MRRGAWRPRCCVVCGEPLEEWSAPLQPGEYIACLPCGRLYVVDDVDGELVTVVLGMEAPELVHVFEDLLAAWWARRDPAGRPAGTTERRAA